MKNPASCDLCYCMDTRQDRKGMSVYEYIE